MSAAAFRDDELKVVVYKPKKPGAAGEDGAWRVSYVDPVTRRRRQPRWRGTRDQVRRKFKALVQDLEHLRDHDWRMQTFEQLCDAYIEERSAEANWNANTLRAAKRNRRLLCDTGELGKQPLGELVLSPRRFREALTKVAKYDSPRTGRPLAKSSLKLTRDFLGTVIAWGQKHEWVPVELDPLKFVSAPKARPGAKLSAKDRGLRDADADGPSQLITAAEVPSMEKAKALGEQWSERSPGRPWWRAMSCELAATTGLRWGEQHALTTTDIEFDPRDPHIKVDRQLYIDASGSVTGTALPKMKRHRKALLPPHLEDQLQRRIAEVEAQVGEGGLLFPSPADPSKPYEPDSFGTTMRNYAPDAEWPVDEHGLLVWTWHSLRHLAAQWQLRDVGLDPAVVSEGLGHSSVRFTLDRYVGTTDDSWAIAAKQMRDWAEKAE